jgi:hypothetical protein
VLSDIGRPDTTFSVITGDIVAYDQTAEAMILLPIERKEGAMESIISNLLSRFEKGSLSRRDLVQGLALLAASGTAAPAQEGLDFKSR